MLDGGEDCDPPGSACDDGAGPFTCSATCQCPCPSIVDFEGNAGTLGILDTGWTGLAHDATIVDEGKLTVDITSCPGSDAGTRPCGVCTFSGPIANPNAAQYPAGPGGDINNHRCTNNNSVVCANNTPCFQQCVGGTNDGAACTSATACPGGGVCPAAGTCEWIFGTYLPLAAGGVSTCVGNRVNGAISGTANVETGTTASTANLISTVYTGPTLAQPCPHCTGDPTENDGIRGGTCTGGQRNGRTCDINGSHPNSQFGSTSLDCQPLVGGVIANLPINLSNTTGTLTHTLSAASPNCRAPGFTSFKCHCDTCNNSAQEPCDDNGDCPDPPGPIAGICGGARCVGGGNAGAACTVPSQCPGGACTRPGAATLFNQCDDATCSPDGGNEGICAAGPFDLFCEPVETFRGCTTNADCPFGGDTCTLGKFRECFLDNGVIGGAVTAQGVADPPVADESDPTLAALFCIGPTTSGAVNGAAGIPGLGKIELPGHARGLP
jgi:hypothetical protein